MNFIAIILSFCYDFYVFFISNYCKEYYLFIIIMINLFSFCLRNSIFLHVIVKLRYYTMFDTIFIVSISWRVRHHGIILGYRRCVIVSRLRGWIVSGVYFFIIIWPFCCIIIRNCIIYLLRIYYVFIFCHFCDQVPSYYPLDPPISPNPHFHSHFLLHFYPSPIHTPPPHLPLNLQFYHTLQYFRPDQ